MVLIVIAVVLGLMALTVLWKGMFKRIIDAMKKSGSSALEAYAVVVCLSSALAAAIYFLVQIV